MLRTICITLALLCSAAAGAQNHPERGLVRKGNRQFDKGDYLQSARRYEQALEAAPGNFEATYDLGGALYRTEAYDKAAQSFAAAAADTLRTDEERAEAFYNLGNARFKQEQYREALESYKQSLRLNPADQEAKYNYAYTKRLLDQQQDQQQDQDKNQDQNQDQNHDQNQSGQGEQNPEQGEQGDQQPQDRSDQGQEPQDGRQEPNDEAGEEGEPQPGISPQEQERMLDAIQAQEDKTQEKIKERTGTVVRGGKNW